MAAELVRRTLGGRLRLLASRFRQTIREMNDASYRMVDCRIADDHH